MWAARDMIGDMNTEDTPELPRTSGETSPENPWPLRMINQRLQEYIGRLTPLWVEGQLVQINRRPGASMAFMTLRDTDVDMSMSLAIYARDLGDVELRDGARVVVHARPTFWPKRGSLQLQAKEIRPVGLGDLLAQIERLKKALAAEGLFAPERKRPLPFLPNRIGLVCGRESKAEHDVVVNTHLRWPAMPFAIREVAVQGAHAVAEVSQAVAELDADPTVDVIVIARGGGSVEDLLPFSNEHLIRVVASCSTPIVSAIGHETDYPLLDLVADLRASTPTDAAKRIVPNLADELHGVTQARARIRAAVTAHLDREASSVALLRTRPVLRDPHAMLVPHAERLTSTTEQLRRALATRLDRELAGLRRTAATLVALSPQSTLERGYAVVRDGTGKILTTADAVAPGTDLNIRLAHGSLRATTRKESA